MEPPVNPSAPPSWGPPPAYPAPWPDPRYGYGYAYGYGYSVPPVAVRPGSVTAAGVITILAGVASLPLGLLLLLLSPALLGFARIDASAALGLAVVGWVVVSGPLALVAGSCLLQRRRWASTMAVVLAGLAPVMSAVIGAAAGSGGGGGFPVVLLPAPATIVLLLLPRSRRWFAPAGAVQPGWVAQRS